MKLKHRKSCFILVLLIAYVLGMTSCQERFPGAEWDRVKNPEDLGYDSEKLDLAKDYTKTIKTAAVVIVVDGVILDEWGEVETEYNTHSIRKSFLSALYGKYVRSGVIDLDVTMEDLDMDDKPPLSETERQATVRDLIKARSGIYHTALYESAGMKALKPERHTEKPGTHWYYNNWDFNALCTIFENKTGKKIFETLYEDIAHPIGMTHFTPEDGRYVTGEESIHAAYPFRITARDMARFGLLMLNKGNWGGKQLIPEDWVEESTRYHSDATLYGCDGYGYMWWVVRHHNKFPHLPNVDLEEGAFSARGAGGHYIIVIPERDMVVVHRVNTWERGNSVSKEEMGTLLKLFLDAKID